MFKSLNKKILASMLALATVAVVVPGCGKCDKKSKECKTSTGKKSIKKKICKACGMKKCMCERK